MTSLTPRQINCLRQHLHHVNAQGLLLNELVDYLACQAEELMSSGISFEEALSIIRLENTSLAIRHLHQTLIRQHLVRTTFWRNTYRSFNQVNAAYGFTQPVRNTLLIGALLNSMLTGCLLASKGLAIPTELVATLLCPLLLLLFLQLFCSSHMHRGTVLSRPSTFRSFSRQTILTRGLRQNVL